MLCLIFMVRLQLLVKAAILLDPNCSKIMIFINLASHFLNYQIFINYLLLHLLNSNPHYLEILISVILLYQQQQQLLVPIQFLRLPKIKIFLILKACLCFQYFFQRSIRPKLAEIMIIYLWLEQLLGQFKNHQNQYSIRPIPIDWLKILTLLFLINQYYFRLLFLVLIIPQNSRHFPNRHFHPNY